VCESISDIKLFFHLVEDSYVFVSGLEVCALFVDTQKNMYTKSIEELKKICLIKWTAQVFVKFFLKLYSKKYYINDKEIV